MKTFAKLILIIVLSYAVQPYMPWWFPAVVAFIVNLIIVNKSGWSAIFCSFFGIALLWSFLCWNAYNGGADIMADKISQLINLPAGYWLILISGFLGGCIALLGGLSGHYFRKIFVKKRAVYYQ